MSNPALTEAKKGPQLPSPTKGKAAPQADPAKGVGENLAALTGVGLAAAMGALVGLNPEQQDVMQDRRNKKNIKNLKTPGQKSKWLNRIQADQAKTA